MATQINIAELQIDNKKLVTSLSQTKKAIDELAAKQKELKDNNDTSSESFVENEARLKALKKEYNSQSKVLQATTKATENLYNVLSKEIKSIDAAKANNQELREIRNQMNSETVEGAKAIEKLNEKIDANTEFIESNVDALEHQKMQVGDYKNQIVDAANELNPLNAGLGTFAQKSNEAGGAGNVFKNGAKGMIQGLLGVTKASIAFIATPVGAVIAALVLAFSLVKNAMNRSEEATNKITRVFASFSGILNGLLGALEPVGEFLIDGLVKGFDLASKAAEAYIGIISKGLRFLGMKDAADGLENFKDKVKESAKAGQELADAEAKLQKEQRKSEKIQLDYQKNAEKLRQIRDDETKSTAERIKANEDLGLLLKKQSEEETRIAQLALNTAILRIKLEGETTEALEQKAEALTKIAEIEERITGQESEQLTNRNAIRKDAADKAKEAANQKIEQMESELNLLMEQNRFEAKNDEERLKQQRKFADEEIAILNEKLKNNLISQTDYNTEKLKIENDLVEKENELKLANEEKELERIKAFDDRKRELENELALIKEEDEQAKAELKIEQDYEKHLLDLENMQLEADEKLALELLLEEQRNEALSEVRKSFNQKAIEEQAAIIKAELDADAARTNALMSNAKTLSGTLISILGDTKAARIASIIAEGIFGVAQIKTNTAQANAQIIANTQIANAKAIAASPTTGGLPFTAFNMANQVKGLAANNAAAGVGITQVLASSAIKATKLERGGLLNGRSHSQGGIPFTVDGQAGFEAEGGEVIINKKSSKMYLPLLSEINAAGGGTKFAQGGIIGSNKPPRPAIDYDLLAAKVAQANQLLPAPVVSVDEINRTQSNVRTIENTATF